MSTHNIGFYKDLIKIIFELSSNTHLISSAGTHTFNMFNGETRIVFFKFCRRNFVAFFFGALWVNSKTNTYFH